MNWKREQVSALEMFVVQVVQVVFPLLIVVWSTCLFSCPPTHPLILAGYPCWLRVQVTRMECQLH